MMKRITCLLSLLLLLFSCNQEAAKTGTTDFKKQDTLISFAGLYVNENYVEDLKQFRSPKKAQDNSEFIRIPEHTLQPTMMISNFHEGGPALTVLKNGNNYELWETENDSLVQLNAEIHMAPGNRIRIGDTFLKKVENASGDLIAEALLFSGNYTDEHGKLVTFDHAGKVTGLDNFTAYAVSTDYYDSGEDVDQVGLGMSKEDLKWFGFEFRKDTLKIYSLDCLQFDSTSNRCAEVRFGKICHSLLKRQ